MVRWSQTDAACAFGSGSSLFLTMRHRDWTQEQRLSLAWSDVDPLLVNDASAKVLLRPTQWGLMCT